MIRDKDNDLRQGQGSETRIRDKDLRQGSETRIRDKDPKQGSKTRIRDKDPRQRIRDKEKDLSHWTTKKVRDNDKGRQGQQLIAWGRDNDL